MRISPRSAKTIRGRYSPQQLAQQGIGAWPDEQRVAFYLNGRPASEPVDPEIVLDLLSRYGYQVTPEMTPAQKKRVIIAFQMHFRPQRWDGVADAQTEAIAEALLEKYGGVSGVVYRGREARRRCARCRRQASPPADSPARPARG